MWTGQYLFLHYYEMDDVVFMSLKEKFERDQRQQVAEQAAIAKENDFYRRMFEEVGIQGEKNRSWSALYKHTLPVELPPEHQALIDEFVELCPPKAWQKAPDKVNREYASAVWKGYPSYSTYLEAEYLNHWSKHEYIGQVKLSDGSVHVYSEPLRLTLNVGSQDKLVRSFLISSFFLTERAEEKAVSFGIEKVLQEMQAKLDCLHQHKYGTGEFVHYQYPGRLEYESQDVYIFRDKTLYDLGDGKGAPYKRSKEDFERLLLSKLKQFSR